MSWEDDFDNQLGLNKGRDAKAAQDKLKALKQRLMDEFKVAIETLKRINTKLAMARKSPTINSNGSGSEFTLSEGTRSVGIKLKPDETGFDILVNGQVADGVDIFVNGDTLVQRNTKREIAAYDLLGEILKKTLLP
jgi:hypothetical protein